MTTYTPSFAVYLIVAPVCHVKLRVLSSGSTSVVLHERFCFACLRVSLGGMQPRTHQNPHGCPTFADQYPVASVRDLKNKIFVSHRILEHEQLWTPRFVNLLFPLFCGSWWKYRNSVHSRAKTSEMYENSDCHSRPNGCNWCTGRCMERCRPGTRLGKLQTFKMLNRQAGAGRIS